MEIETLKPSFAVCKLSSLNNIDLDRAFVFLSKTDEELSLVCEAQVVPIDATDVEDGFTGLRIKGVLDFSMVGVLSHICGLLAEAGVSVFAVSTYNTDYIFVRQASYALARDALTRAGYTLLQQVD